MSRILWLSNAAWGPSGYGEQTALFAKRLRALGHDVSLMCNWGLMGMVTDWHGFTVYPADNRWGNETLASYAEHSQADIVIALCDAFVLKPEVWPDTQVAVWAPVDHYPIPPAVLGALAQPNVRPIAMSRFGERMMNDCQLDPFYVPHGYDPAVFAPRPELRDKVRDQLHVPRDAFLVGMVAANKGNPSLPRKAFPQAFNAFANFRRDRPDAWLYVHSTAGAGPEGGIDLAKLSQMLGLDGRILFPDDKAWHLGMGSEVVAYLYQAFDVLLAPSMGEGFGIPILEAQASGCPVIVSDHSAMTELCGAGWLVSGDPWWDALSDSFFIVPSIASITEALEHAYEARGDKKLRGRAVEFAQAYDCNAVTYDHWMPVLDALAPKDESRQVRRARERREAKRAKVSA